MLHLGESHLGTASAGAEFSIADAFPAKVLAAAVVKMEVVPVMEVTNIQFRRNLPISGQVFIASRL